MLFDSKKHYNVVTSKDTNFADALTASDAHDQSFKTHEFDDFNVHVIELTSAQAKKLADAGHEVEEDKTIKIPPVVRSKVKKHSDTAAVKVDAAAPTILTDIPQYSGTLKNQDVVVMDTRIYPDSPALKDFKVVIQQSFVGDTSCYPHGTEVASVIAREFDPAKTDLTFYNFAVFDCDGSASVSVLVEAVKAIIAFHKQKGNDRGLTVNFSGGGDFTNVLNKVFTQLPRNGINLVVAAGNSSKDCTTDSPASASSHAGIISAGATGNADYTAENGQTIAPYSNYAKKADCVTVYAPGCFEMLVPPKYDTEVACGTSFASPLVTGTVLVAKELNSKATPAQIKAERVESTVTVPAGEYGINMRAMTPELAFSFNAAKAKAESLADKAEAAGKAIKDATVDAAEHVSDEAHRAERNVRHALS